MSKKTFFAFVMSLLLLLTVVILNRQIFKEMKEYTGAVDHTREVISCLQRLSNHFKSAQIYTSSDLRLQSVNFYGLYKREADSIPREIEYLQLLVPDSTEQQDLIDTIGVRILTQLAPLMQKSIAEIIESGDQWRLNDLFIIHNMINRAIANENNLLADRKERLRKSTSLNNLLTSGFAMLALGIIISYFINTFFISRKRRWLEGFLESVLNTSSNGVIYFKAVREEGSVKDFKVDFVNRATVQLVGLPPEQLMGTALTSFLSAVTDSDMLERYKTVVETGQGTVFETQFNNAGQEKWLIVSLAKLEDGVTASFQDITQLKVIEQELKSNITQLQRSNDELEQYAYVASHDLQEPLRKIRSFASYLQETQSSRLDEKGQMQLSRIMNSAERMSVLIRDILSFSSTRRDADFQPTDLNSILQNVLQDFELSIEQLQVKLKITSLPVIDAIPLQMNQLFYNLINNSLKFVDNSRQSFIEISARLVSEDEKSQISPEMPGVWHELRFVDNGIGFSQEYAEQIFGLFKRLNDKQIYPGSGIGLALCKKVVDNHGGYIRAIGVNGESAEFRIYLPAHHEKVK